MTVDRRGFLASAGAALGSFAVTGLGGVAAASGTGSHLLNPVTAGDPRIGRLRGMRSAQVAQRTFGPLDWSAVHEAPLHFGDSASLVDERVYYVPMKPSGATRTLLALSDPCNSPRERRVIDAAGARTGDRSLFNDDVVVELRLSGDRELRWMTVDGRELGARQVSGEQRVRLGSAGDRLAHGLSHSPLALSSGLGGGCEAEPARRGAGPLPLLLFQAGASGKRRIRRCGRPMIAAAV